MSSLLNSLMQAKVLMSIKGLDAQEMSQRDDINAMVSNPYPWPGSKDQQNKTDKFLSVFGVMYVIVNSRKDKGKALKEHILKDIVPRGFDARIKEIQKKHRQAIEEKDVAVGLLADDLQDRDNQIQAIHYENVGLQGKIREKDQHIDVLKRDYVGYLSDKDKNNGISIIAKNNEEEEYSYISICGKHGYKRHKVRVLLARNQCSTLFADGDTPNAIVTYNFQREHELTRVDPGRPRNFRLDMIN